MIGTPAIAEEGSENSSSASQSLFDAITNGDASLSFRYRYGFIDDDNVTDTAKASTLQTLLGFRTDTYKGVSGFIQFRDVSHIGSDDFNDTLNGKTSFPVEADPESTALHQAYVSYKGIPDTEIVVGRRLLKYDNQRFIGSLAWRQNARTFDGVFVKSNALADNIELNYSFANRINRGFTDRSPKGQFDGDTNIHLMNVGIDFGDTEKLSVYSYLIDLDGFAGSENLSNATYGASFGGKWASPMGVPLTYRAEYARQTDYGENPASYDLGYWHLQSGLTVSKVKVELGYEVLESDGQNAIRAPLGLLHAFGGWADRFLPAPAQGLEDVYLKSSYTVQGSQSFLDGAKLLVHYHDYQSNSASLSYGAEWNFAAIKKLNDHITASVHAADYAADEFSADVQKMWFSLSARF